MSGQQTSNSERKRTTAAVPLAMLFASIVVVAFIVSDSTMTQGERTMGSAFAYRVAEDLGAKIDMYLAAGKVLRSAIEADPGIGDAQSKAIAEGILAGNPGIIVGVSTAPGAVIDRYYPAQTGVAWKGHDLLSNPERKDALLKAVELKTPVVTGPFEAVDGSSSLFLRYPVFSNGKVWGFSSLTVDFPKLLSSLGLDKRYPGIYFALADVSQAKSPLFIGGKEAAMAGKGTFADLSRQGIAWRIYAAPATGWANSSPFFYVLLVSGLIAAAFLYVLLAGKAPARTVRKPRNSEEKPSWAPARRPEEAPSVGTPPEPLDRDVARTEPQREKEPRLNLEPRLEAVPEHLRETAVRSLQDRTIGAGLFPDLGIVEEKRGRAIAFKGPAVKGDLFMPERILTGWPEQVEGQMGSASPPETSVNVVASADAGASSAAMAEPVHDEARPDASPQGAQEYRLEAISLEPSRPTSIQPVSSQAPPPQPSSSRPAPARHSSADYLFSLEEEKPGNNLAILVVDDSEANRDIVGRMLSLRGYKADFAASGTEALNLAASRSYDVIFMDSYMPGMDGLATTRALRAANLTTGAFIVGMSAKIGEQELDKCRASGMDDLLAKPFTLKQLIAFLDRPRS